MDIHVCLISNQPIPNLVPLLLEKPDRAIFLVSPEMQSRAERLKEVVLSRGIRVEMKEISAYDFTGVSNVCREIISAEAGNKLAFNVTGGTKVSALAAFQIFYFENKRIIYLRTDSGELIDLAPQECKKKLPENIITLKEYLACYGFIMQSNGRPATGYDRRKKYLKSLAIMLSNSSDLLRRLNSAIAKNRRGDYANIPFNELGDGAEKLAGILEQCGVAGQTGGNILNIPSREKIFFCQGGWLEEFVYMTVAQACCDIRPVINAEVVWEGGGKVKTRNEFDVLFVRHNRLHIVSCKTSDPNRENIVGVSRAKEALYELDVLAEKAGGLFAGVLLVSARELSPFDKERAEKMHIKMVDGKAIQRLAEYFSEWVS